MPAATANRPPGPGKSKEREERVKRALANSYYFAIAYFKPYDAVWNAAEEDLAPFASEMMRFWQGCRGGWPNAGGVTILPPEFMKTTLGQAFDLWTTARARVFEELLRGLIFSEQEDMAKASLAVLKWHILHNERLAADFVDRRGRPLLIPDPDMEKWSEDAIIIARPGMVSRDPTWQAKGLNSTGIQGRRLTYVRGDDVVTPQNADSPAKRDDALKIWEETIEYRVVAGGTILMLGNFNNSKDLLSTMTKRPRYQVFKRPSLHRPDDPSKPPKEGHLTDPARALETWPQVWSRQRLMVEYREKPAKFRRIHLLDPRAEQGERLQIGWMRQVPEDAGEQLLRYAKFYLGVDPAPGGETEDLDFFVVTVLAVTLHHADIVKSHAMRGDTPSQVELVGALHNIYNRIGYGVQKIGGGKVTLDRYFAGALTVGRPDLKRKLHPVSIPGDKETRLEGLGPRAKTGWLRCWEPTWSELTSDAVDQKDELSLQDEWREFPYGNHDDRLDSLDVACRTAEEDGEGATYNFTLTVAEE